MAHSVEPAQPPARLGMQVHGGREPPGVENEVAGEAVARGRTASSVTVQPRTERPPRTPLSAAFTSRVVPGGGCGTRRRLAPLDDRDDLNAGRGECRRHRIGVITVRGNHHALAAAHAEGAGVARRGARQHHARAIVVRKEQRPFEGAGRRDHCARADLPQALAQHTGGQRGITLGAHALAGAHEIVVVDAESDACA